MVGEIIGPELVFGLVGPVGVDLDMVCGVLHQELSRVNYSAKILKLSELMHQIPIFKDGLEGLSREDEYQRIKGHMKAGTSLRKDVGRGDIMARLAMSEIRRIRGNENAGREDIKNPQSFPLPRHAFILRSLKHPEEVEFLQDLYKEGFWLISAYAPRAKRVESLSTIIARTKSSSDRDGFRAQAEELIAIDEREEGEDLGQNVTEAFPLADLFVNARSAEKAAFSIARFVEILFGYPFHSPTRDETGMFYAKSAALRSADLSRQVGAAISTPDGDLISIGCNDVPKAGGGLYWCDDHEDYRDFRRGRDSSVEFKEDIIRELLQHLAEAGWIDKTRASEKSKAMMEEILYGKQSNPLKGSQVMNIIEYGRSVHAEMAALSDAAMRGNSVRGAYLHVTTFPCHLCARHIVAAGIKRVVYIEPYPKSMAPHLYEDSIVVDPAEPVEGRVVFEPFVGISPRRYVDLFEVKGKRKDKRGHAFEWNPAGQIPRIQRHKLAYILAEEEQEVELEGFLSKFGFQLENSN